MNLNGGRAIKDRPSSPVIFESQKFVRARIERRWLMLFKQTTEFLERQKSHAVGIPEMVEDIMLKRRLQRSEAAWKVKYFEVVFDGEKKNNRNYVSNVLQWLPEISFTRCFRRSVVHTIETT